MRPQRKRRASRVPRAARGECEGRPGGRWFSGLFSGRPAPSPGKEPGKASRPLPGKRVPRQAAVARLGPSWKRVVSPAGRPGGGSPRAGPWARVRGGASPGFREGPGFDRIGWADAFSREGKPGRLIPARAILLYHAYFVYNDVNYLSMPRQSNISELEQLAASQWGMFTTAQAQALGFRRNQVSRMVDSMRAEPMCYGERACERRPQSGVALDLPQGNCCRAPRQEALRRRRRGGDGRRRPGRRRFPHVPLHLHHGCQEADDA